VYKCYKNITCIGDFLNIHAICKAQGAYCATTLKILC